MKCVINNHLVDVKVLKTRKLFWIFEQVLVTYRTRHYYYDKSDTFTTDHCEWIPKSNLITTLSEKIEQLDNSKLRVIMAELNCDILKKYLIKELYE